MVVSAAGIVGNVVSGKEDVVGAGDAEEDLLFVVNGDVERLLISLRTKLPVSSPISLRYENQNSGTIPSQHPGCR